MAIHKKHPRGSSGNPDESTALPDLHRRNQTEEAIPQEKETDEERWRDDGGESGETV